MHQLREFFEFGHLPAVLQDISREFGKMAEQLDDTLEDGDQKNVAMQHLLDAKDAAVRAKLREVNRDGREH